MVLALPSRIMNYKVTADSPTGELITLGRILAEVGDAAATVLDRDHLTFARRCATRLKRVVAELLSRHTIESPEDLYNIAETPIEQRDLTSMTIDELYILFRQWPLRQQASKVSSGIVPSGATYTRSNSHPDSLSDSLSESLSDSLPASNSDSTLEDLIVNELRRRRPTSLSDHLKIDYCLSTFPQL